MNLSVAHRRLAIAASMFALLGYGGGVGLAWPSGWIAGAILALAFFWSPPPEMGERIEQLWLPVALLLVVRALFSAFVLQEDLVLPVVDLLLLLLCAEALRPLEAPNHSRLYALVFALMLASTAYRPGLIFAVAFLGSSLTLVPALVVGHLMRESQAYGGRRPNAVRDLHGPTIAASVATVVFAIFIFVAFPRISRDTVGRDPGTSTAVAGFADAVTLGAHGSVIGDNPEVVLRVEFPSGNLPDPASLYWRGRSYDHFDGVRWTRTRTLRPSIVPDGWYEAWEGPEVEQTIYSARLNARILPALHPVTELRTTSNVHPMRDTSGDMLYWGSGDPVYTAVSKARSPHPDSLRTARGNFVPGGTAFRQLPQLDIDVIRLGDSLTRGIENRYDRVVAIRDWFHSEFTYTRQLPATSGEATIEHFLFERRAGHCEYFSTAMVVLLRSVGIESREVNGFLGGDWNPFGRYLAVTQNQAHSWVEVWFPGYGWVTFDPTPSTLAGEAAAASFRWPALRYLDGLRHRWNKWVLDYSPEQQSALLDRIRGNEQTLESNPDPKPAAPPPWMIFLIIAAIAASSLSLWRVWTGRQRRPETRGFQRLRRAYSRLTQGEVASAGPVELIGALRRGGLPLAAEAEPLIRAYMTQRFSKSASEPEARRLEREAIRLSAKLRRMRIGGLTRSRAG